MTDALKLTMSFPFSNQSYCQIFGGENQQCLLQGMKNIFEYMGKVPYRIVFDNLSSAVAHMGKGHDRTLTDGFERFMAHYKFEAAFCNGAAGWEKGNVENKVGYERRNMFVPVPTILDFSLFNQKLFEACNKDAKREHYVKNSPIESLFCVDLSQMLPINEISYDIYLIEPRRTDNYAKVTFDNNRYSSSPRYAQENVYVKATSDSVWILNESYEVIILYTMLLTHDMRTAENALEFAISNGVNDADSVLAAYRTLTSGAQQLQPMQLSANIISMPSFTTNNKKYDELFDKEICL